MKLDLSVLEDSISVLEKSITVVMTYRTFDSDDVKATLRSGLIQNFEVAYEQCWKMMKRWIEQNVNPSAAVGLSRRELFRLAAANQLISDIDEWMVFHEARNKTSHIYDIAVAADVETVACQFIHSAKTFLKQLQLHND